MLMKVFCQDPKDFDEGRGVVYGAREAHNLTDKVQLLTPQQMI